MMQQNTNSSKEFNLWELVTILLIIQFLIVFLYPLFAKRRSSGPSICASNLKQIGLVLIGYTQDYDEKFPPAVGGVRLPDGTFYEQQWGIDTTVTIAGKQTQIPSLTDAYIKNKGIFRCPLVKESKSGLTYLYNDLAAGESPMTFSSIALTVLGAEGDDHLRNVGHAKSPNPAGEEAILSPRLDDSSPSLLLGATIGDASIRHSDGANYLFADGHVKWTKPDAVFFPPRTSSRTNHHDAETGRLLGPDPGGDMTYQGKTYIATFHLQ